MAFTIPSRESIFAAFIGDYAAAQPDKNVARGSDPYRLGRVVSGVIWTLAAKLLYYVKQALPDTAEAAFLERWGAVYSFTRLPAASASAKAGLRVLGTIGNAVSFGAQLAHADGTVYQVTTTGAVIGGGGSVDVDVTAVSTGLATNKGVGEVLTFTSPDPGITSAATVVVKLTNGLDIETYDAYRVRLLAHIGDPPEGGAIHDYQEWALTIPGTATAYVWAHRRGRGTIDVAVLGLGTGANRVCNGTVTGAVDTYIETVRPGNVRDFAVLTTTTQTQDVTCTITIDASLYAWDWDDAGIGYAITASDSSLKTVTVPTAPASVIAGKRIQILGEEALVTNRVGNVLTVSFQPDYDGNTVTWFTFSPTGQNIRASGDCVRPTKNSILALFNTLGPARSTYSKTAWISDLRLSKLFAAITDTAGVDDATISTPVANVVTVDPYDTTVPVLIPGKIQVLKP